MKPELIDIYGTPVLERFLIAVDTHPIKLTGKSFKYLFMLAWGLITKAGGWIYKEDIEPGYNQSRYMYRLREEINNFAGASTLQIAPGIAAWPVSDNNRCGYYRLLAEPGAIRFHLRQLRRFPDHDVREKTADLRKIQREKPVS